MHTQVCVIKCLLQFLFYVNFAKANRSTFGVIFSHEKSFFLKCSVGYILFFVFPNYKCKLQKPLPATTYKFTMIYHIVITNAIVCKNTRIGKYSKDIQLVYLYIFLHSCILQLVVDFVCQNAFCFSLVLNDSNKWIKYHLLVLD